MSKSGLNKDSMYMAYYDVKTDKLIHEYIPVKYNWLNDKLRHTYLKARLKLNRPVYYWHYRFYLDPESRKIEDIQLIIHILKDHDGKPEDRNERLFWDRLNAYYGMEIRNLIMPYLYEKEENEPLLHPYYLAYKKRWLQPVMGEAKLMYHGVDGNELEDIIFPLIDRIKKRHKNYLSNRSYHKKKMEKKK